MIIPGLVSVTFRNLKPKEILKLVKNSGLCGIEWGGDIHVPHGDLQTAKEVYILTADAGLEVAAYGSYYRVGCEDNNFDSFKRIAETAVELHAPIIRVWAGDKGSKESNESWRQTVVENSLKIAEIAADAKTDISFEFHGNTLTDSNESAIDFYNNIKHPNLKAYWQPNTDMTIDQRTQGLESLSSILTNVHVFQWSKDENNNTVMHSLREGFDEWSKYLNYISTLDGTHFALLEFVKNGEPHQFVEDAMVFKEMLGI